jgi:ankyrin repeat protein
MIIPPEVIAAVKNGDIDIIKEQLNDNIHLCNLHDVDNFNMTLLHIATAADKIEVIDCLLSYTQVDINATQKLGRTALHMAAIKDKLHLIEYLLDNGINVIQKDKSKKKALDLAKSKKSIELLAAATLNEKDYFLNQLSKSNYIYLRRKLKESERYKTFCFPDGNTQLHYAISAKNYELIQFLIDEKYNISSLNRDGIAPIHLALIKNDLVIIQKMITESTINQRDSQDLTPLHYFLAANDPNDFVEPNPPAYINPMTEDKITQNDNQTSFLFDFDNSVAPIKNKKKITDKPYNIFELLLNAGADINAIARGGITSLHFAADAGKCKIIDYLIKQGVDINAQTKTTGSTPLHIAFNNDHEDAIKLLIANGANIDITDYYGRRYNEI